METTIFKDAKELHYLALVYSGVCYHFPSCIVVESNRFCKIKAMLITSFIYLTHRSLQKCLAIIYYLLSFTVDVNQQDYGMTKDCISLRF